MDRKSNIQRSLARSKRLVKAVNFEKKKNETKIKKLTKQIKWMKWSEPENGVRIGVQFLNDLLQQAFGVNFLARMVVDFPEN